VTPSPETVPLSELDALWSFDDPASRDTAEILSQQTNRLDVEIDLVRGSGTRGIRKQSRGQCCEAQDRHGRKYQTLDLGVHIATSC